MNTDRTMWAIMFGFILLQIIGSLVCLWIGKSLSLKQEISIKDGKIFKKKDIINSKEKYSKILKNIGIVNVTLGVLTPIISAIVAIFIKGISVPMLSIAIVVFSIFISLMYVYISLIITIISSNIKIGYKVIFITIIIAYILLPFTRPELIKNIIK